MGGTQHFANIERKQRERANIRRDIEATQARIERSTSEGEKTFLRTKLGALRRALIQRGQTNGRTIFDSDASEKRQNA